ncbi:hypothetical protein EVAR_23698_1 [Eumeta japonica]|uniref:Uncharacterized protein n=1 Tax=Eumeta variegata TaxID=151549 RepID=A0A4C1VGR2_EUMVA|nr:hypothetical protein EVAR_23698_1 [Eumeta japonica]
MPHMPYLDIKAILSNVDLIAAEQNDVKDACTDIIPIESSFNYEKPSDNNLTSTLSHLTSMLIHENQTSAEASVSRSSSEREEAPPFGPSTYLNVTVKQKHLHLELDMNLHMVHYHLPELIVAV